MGTNRQPWILGISASHNGAVCLLHGDEIVVAIQEERLSRQKRHRIYGAEPSLSLLYCLKSAGIQPHELSLVVLCAGERAKSPQQDIRSNPVLKEALSHVPALTIPHHYGHAMSAYALSGFREAAILVIDGMGSPSEDLFPDEASVAKRMIAEGGETVSLYLASDTFLIPLEKHLIEYGAWLLRRGEGMPRFGSLGGLFSAVACQIFDHSMDAGKVMGLAPYGAPAIPTKDFFDISGGEFIFHDTVPRRFTHNDRWPRRAGEYQDLARSAQVALEDAVLYLARHLRSLSQCDNLCYAGGVALNSVANERIIHEVGFKNVFITPAAEDSGPAVGAAYYGLWQMTRENTRRRIVHDACGRPYSSACVSAAIQRTPGVRAIRSHDTISDTVDLLCDGKIVGWFDGRSELGPRALGQRSILCDPRRADGKETLNLRVKRREAFRPFAPAILLEEAGNWFEANGAGGLESPFMLRVCDFKPDKRALVPAVVHVDGTGRVQTVTRHANGRFYELIRKFYERTGIPLLLNTSFNVMGEPIVETPADAISCLLRSGLDCCVFEDQIVFRYVDW
jgi:carbamoyltransferase